MKQSGSFSRFAVYGVALSAAFLVSSAEANVGKAAVRAVRGSASYSDGSGGWNKLSVGKILKPGNIIRTESQSSVDLFLDQNGPVVRVTEATQMGIDKLDYEATGEETVIETQLDLKSGRILGNVKKMAAASKYEVKTPNGVAGIRGTEYDISASGVVRVLEGSVVVVYVTPTATYTQVVNTGEEFNPATGKVQPIDVNVAVDDRQQIKSFTGIFNGPNGPLIVIVPTTDNAKSGPVPEDTRKDEQQQLTTTQPTTNPPPTGGG